MVRRLYLAWIAGQYYPQLDQMKVLEMLLLRGLAEVQTAPDGNRQREALAAMLAQLPNSADYLATWDEYEAGETPEATLIRLADWLEMAMSATNTTKSKEANYEL